MGWKVHSFSSMSHFIWDREGGREGEREGGHSKAGDMSGVNDSAGKS